jgi:uncharacterized phage infection (PIP) family protein YhgE
VIAVSDVQQLKQELHQVSTDAKQAAGGLNDFKSKFSEHSGRVQALISGTATGKDAEITQLLEAAQSAVDAAASALQQAAEGCRSYAGQI